jgi:pimeloyl-ACP methyl ester carboxylesterase
MTEANAVAVTDQAVRRGMTAGKIIAGAVLASAAGVAAAEMFKLPVNTSAPGDMVLRRHGRTHMTSRRTGDGPTVVFENGLGTPLTAWSWVVQRLRDDVPFVTYDRPGIGWSHSAPPDWRRDYPADLHDLLGLCNARPPFILVGHSIGGLLIRIFADRYPELVGGLVFVDPSSPQQYERSQAARDGLLAFKEHVDRMKARSAFRLPLPETWTAPMRRLPDQVAAPSVRAMGRHAALRATRHETDLSESSWAEGAALLTSTPHPVAVVTSGVVRRADPDYVRLVEEIADLSEISHTDVVDDADHMSLLCDRGHAAQVADAIQWVVDKCPRPPLPDSDTAPFTTTETTPCDLES